jgi:hypothetical protein
MHFTPNLTKGIGAEKTGNPHLHQTPPFLAIKFLAIKFLAINLSGLYNSFALSCRGRGELHYLKSM